MKRLILFCKSGISDRIYPVSEYIEGCWHILPAPEHGRAYETDDYAQAASAWREFMTTEYPTDTFFLESREA